MRLAVGVDGTRGGWVAVALRDGRVADVRAMDDLASVIGRFGAAPTAVDIPIGLSDEPQRAADIAARALLAGRTASVFPAPCRSVVDAYRAGAVRDHEEATALSRRVTGAGLPLQSWALVPRIAEADALVADGVALYEVHPELAFALLAGHRLARKRTWNDIMARLAILRGVGVELPATVTGGDRLPPDDVVDAAVVAWTAAGLHQRAGLRSHPAEPRQYDRGRPIAIWTRP